MSLGSAIFFVFSPVSLTRKRGFDEVKPCDQAPSPGHSRSSGGCTIMVASRGIVLRMDRLLGRPYDRGRFSGDRPSDQSPLVQTLRSRSPFGGSSFGSSHLSDRSRSLSNPIAISSWEIAFLVSPLHERSTA